MGRPFRVCIDARLGPPGSLGGVQQVVVGLATGLATVARDDEEYLFLADPEAETWLAPLLVGRCRLLRTSDPRTPSSAPWRRAVKAVVPRPWIEAPYRMAAGLRERMPPRIPHSDGTVERAGVDVLHQTLQFGFTSGVPTIYMPYDLQHLHLPELFPERERRRRAVFYPGLATKASAVVSISRWGKQDIIHSLGIAPEKVRVVHCAPAVDSCPDPSPSDLDRLRTQRALPPVFALYPAQTWPHKNHLGLLDALAWLRDRRGTVVPVVFTGHQGEFFPVIEKRALELGLTQQVRFLGFIPPLEMRGLYRLSRMLVFPSLFEGFGMPVVEAFRMGVPVACSRASALPEVAGDAAVLFDPEDVEEMATSIARLWNDPALQAELRTRGSARAGDFTWQRAAQRYRALYRWVAGHPLDGETQRLLDDTL